MYRIGTKRYKHKNPHPINTPTNRKNAVHIASRICAYANSLDKDNGHELWCSYRENSTTRKGVRVINIKIRTGTQKQVNQVMAQAKFTALFHEKSFKIYSHHMGWGFTNVDGTVKIQAKLKNSNFAIYYTSDGKEVPTAWNDSNSPYYKRPYLCHKDAPTTRNVAEWYMGQIRREANRLKLPYKISRGKTGNSGVYFIRIKIMENRREEMRSLVKYADDLTISVFLSCAIGTHPIGVKSAQSKDGRVCGMFGNSFTIWYTRR